jgi:ElaB/YqjD/DUF883 family membrane-anchored ribosome-binding protein
MTDSPVNDAAGEAARAAEAARNELGETLDAIEDKFNVKKRSQEMLEKAQHSYDENPVPWIAGATAVLIAVGGLVAWALFSNDD